MDLGRRVRSQVLREIRCLSVSEVDNEMVMECIEAFPKGPEINGQSSAELGEHVSSSTLSVHQMPARDDLWKGFLSLVVVIRPGKESARTHDLSAAPPPDLHPLFNEVCLGPGIVGLEAKAAGPRLALASLESSWGSA